MMGPKPRPAVERIKSRSSREVARVFCVQCGARVSPKRTAAELRGGLRDTSGRWYESIPPGVITCSIHCAERYHDRVDAKQVRGWLLVVEPEVQA